MGRSEYYRAQAERCTRLANSCDPETRERLLELANENSLMARGLSAKEQQRQQS